MISVRINIEEREFLNMLHKIVMEAAEIKAPIAIAQKQWLSFKFESPLIKLPDHTPVSGIGIDTKPARAIYLPIAFLFSSCAPFIKYFCKNFECRKSEVCFFIFLAKSITAMQGRMLPTKERRRARSGERALLPQMAVFIARGIAILLSSVGIIATIKTASQTKEEKLSAKKSIILFIL